MAQVKMQLREADRIHGLVPEPPKVDRRRRPPSGPTKTRPHVDNIAGTDRGEISVRVLHGEFLKAMLDRATPHITYWPTLRTADYDQMHEGIP
jgi:hypothetical protein